MKIKTAQDLFVTQIQHLYSEEERLTEALPKMAQASSSARLREAFQNHLEQTWRQLRRLEQVFGDLGRSPEGEKTRAAKGLVEDAEDLISGIEQSPLRDAGLIAAGKSVEHYEMAAYESARSLARLLGYANSERLLAETLEEEKQADAILTRVAEEAVNQEALQLGAHQVK